MSYLFLAYSLVWLLIFGYMVYIGNIQKRLSEEVKLLKEEAKAHRGSPE